MCLSVCTKPCIRVHSHVAFGIFFFLMFSCQTHFPATCWFVCLLFHLTMYLGDDSTSAQENLLLPFLMAAGYSVAGMCPECECSYTHTSWHTCSKILVGSIRRRKLLHHKACSFPLWHVGSNCPPQRQRQPESQQLSPRPCRRWAGPPCKFLFKWTVVKHYTV